MLLLHSGKVRDVFLDGEDLVLVASDRISVYDVVLPTPIPDKGKVLTQLSLWWFSRLADVVGNHVISGSDVPPEFAGRAIRCRRLSMLPVEAVARGYLAGGGLRDYQQHGAISGVGLPPGLVEGSRLPEPIFTPSTKAPIGKHDRPISYADLVAAIGADTAQRVRELTLELYRRGAERAAAQGILVADTKFEFGVSPEGELLLADEVLTPDSSRFWPADRWEPGRSQYAFDKQFVRDWAAGTGWDKRPPAPAIPDDVVAATRARYLDAFERLTGQRWPAGASPARASPAGVSPDRR